MAKDRPEMDNVIKELKAMSVFSFIKASVSFTLQNSREWIPPPPAPPEEPIATAAGPSISVTHNPIVDEIEVMTSYDVDAPPPAPPPPQKVEKRPPAWKVKQGIGEGSTNDIPLEPLSVGGRFLRLLISLN